LQGIVKTSFASAPASIVVSVGAYCIRPVFS